MWYIFSWFSRCGIVWFLNIPHFNIAFKLLFSVQKSSGYVKFYHVIKVLYLKVVQFYEYSPINLKCSYILFCCMIYFNTFHLISNECGLQNSLNFCCNITLFYSCLNYMIGFHDAVVIHTRRYIGLYISKAVLKWKHWQIT